MLAVLAGGYLALLGKGDESDPATTRTSAVAGPTARTPSPSRSAAPSPTAIGTTAPSGPVTPAATTSDPTGGLVEIAPGAATDGDQVRATAVSATLEAYFSAVNDKDLDRAYAMYSPRLQSKNPYPEWSRGISGTTVEQVRLVSVSDTGAGDGRVTATVTFVSRQPPELGPAPGQACTRWSLDYSLVSDGSGYLIDRARPQTPGGRGYADC